MIKLMTYNIRLGKQRDLHAIADVINEHAPDLVALQEVGDHWLEGPRGDSLRILSQLTALPYTTYLPTITEPNNQRYGHGVLSKHPLLHTTHHRLPRAEDEPRGIIEARLSVDGASFTLLTTHLSWIQDRHAQGPVLRDLVDQRLARGEDVIVMGDLNEHESPDWLTSLLSTMRDADSLERRDTYPSCAPRIRIDYVLASAGQFAHTIVPREPMASDHDPVITEWTPA